MAPIILTSSVLILFLGIVATRSVWIAIAAVAGAGIAVGVPMLKQGR